MSRPPDGISFKRGGAIRAADLQSIRRQIAERATLDIAGKRTRPAPVNWFGQIMPRGPLVHQVDEEGQPVGQPVQMPDFADSRYWVQEISLNVVKVQEYPNGLQPIARSGAGGSGLFHGQNTFDVRGHYNPLPQGRSAIVAALNLSEVEQATHNLPWGTIVQLQTWTTRSSAGPTGLAHEAKGTDWPVFSGPAQVTLEVRIDTVMSRIEDAGSDFANPEVDRLRNLFLHLGPYFKCRRLIRSNGQFGQPPVLDLAQFLVCMPQGEIDILKFMKVPLNPNEPPTQIYNIDGPGPTFLASNGARGLTLWHTTCSTPLVDPPTASELCGDGGEGGGR